MIKEDFLFELIRTMTKSEKRTFKLNTGYQKGEKLYLRLFEILENEKEYDEEIVKQKIKDPSFIKNLPRNKRYLYQLILKSLQDIVFDDPDILFYELMIQSKILINKGLYNQAEELTKTIEKKTTIIEREKSDYLISLRLTELGFLTRKNNYFGRASNEGDILADIHKYLNEIDEYLKVLPNYLRVMNELQINGPIKFDSAKKKDLKYLVLSDNEFSNPSGFILVKNKDYAFMLHLIYWLIDTSEENNRFEQTAIAYLKMLEENRSTFSINKERYLMCINNIASMADAKLLFNIMDICVQHLAFLLEFIRNSPIKNVDFESKVLAQLFCEESSILLRQKKYKESWLYFEKNEGLVLPTFKYVNVGIRIMILNNIVLSNIYNGKFQKTYKHLLLLNRLINTINKDNDTWVFHRRLISLIVFYETNEYSLFESTYRATERLSKKNSYNSKAIQIILKYLFELQTLTGKKDKSQVVFKKFKDELLILETLPEENEVLNHFPYTSWAKSKILGVNICDL